MSGILSRDEATRAADRMKVLAQPQRLLILSALVGRELAVGAIETETAIVQPALSQQLAELRRAGFVTTRRSSKQVLYSLVDQQFDTVVRFVTFVFGRDGDPSSIVHGARSVPDARQSGSAAVFATVIRAGD